MSTFGKRRALGQHFLIDDRVRLQIAQTAIEEALRNGSKALLEIGPGRGALTDHLVAPSQTIPVTLVEKDFALYARWKALIGKGPLQRVIEGDFTDLKKEDWLVATPMTVVSNLPYSAGTAIFTRLAAEWHSIPSMVLMFQKEVGDRLHALPSTPDRGSLSLFTQNLWEVSRLMLVPPKAFRPAPEVMSSVILLRARPTPLIPGTDEPAGDVLWQKFLKLAFTHRRKMLRSGLPDTGPWKNALETSGVDPTLRPEALDWPEWKALFEALRAVETPRI